MPLKFIDAADNLTDLEIDRIDEPITTEVCGLNYVQRYWWAKKTRWEQAKDLP